VALIAGLGTLFLEWNTFLVWQLVVLVAVQFACLVVVLGESAWPDIRSSILKWEPQRGKRDRRSSACVACLC
jgi:hypothetical protein